MPLSLLEAASLQNLKNKGVYAHFTNSGQMRPGGEILLSNAVNPYGFYGFPINDKFFQEAPQAYSDRSQIVLWKPKTSKIVDSSQIEALRREASSPEELTKNLKDRGIDGVLSKNYQMSKDMFEELVIFDEDNIDILGAVSNTLYIEVELEKAQREFEQVAQYEKYKDHPWDGTRRGDKGEQYRNALQKLAYYQKFQ